VPKSRTRKKSDYTAPAKAAVKVGSPVWLVPLKSACRWAGWPESSSTTTAVAFAVRA